MEDMIQLLISVLSCEVMGSGWGMRLGRIIVMMEVIMEKMMAVLVNVRLSLALYDQEGVLLLLMYELRSEM